MKITDIKEGEIFTIQETPSYPKLRTKTGYIDMRDKIINNNPNLDWEVRAMPKEEVAKKFEGIVEEVDNWIKETKALLSN